jgi:RNA polymerase sigma-70 factor, ECF subfamily
MEPRPSPLTAGRVSGVLSLDAESREWIESLSAEGAVREEAARRLHELLLRAARFEVNRRRATLPHVRGEDAEDLALQSANDALAAVLAKLREFRGASRFTTWAYKFALLEAGVKLRRRAWQEREVPLEPEAWPAFEAKRPSPDAEVEAGELMVAVRDAIAEELTPHQREVLVAIALNDVPIDVLAERRGTSRGALYKTLHDARKKLRARLAEQGFAVERVREVDEG